METGFHATLAETLARLPGPAGERSVRALAHGRLEIKLYAPRGTDPQTPHDRDEAYVVAAGRGDFLAGGERRAVGPGDVLLVPRGVAHRFEGFGDDFAAWVLFFGPAASGRRARGLTWLKRSIVVAALLAVAGLGHRAWRERRVHAAPGSGDATAASAPAAAPEPAPPRPPPEAETRREGGVESAPPPEYARFGDGFLVWESRRSGNWRIWTRRLEGSGLRQLSPDEGDRQHCCPHISPDGRTVVYLSHEGGHDRYIDDAVGPLHRIEPGGDNDQVLVAAAKPYAGGHRAVVWRSPDELVFVGGDKRTGLLEVASGKVTDLAGPDSHGWPWLLDATLGHGSSDATFAPYDAATRTVTETGVFGGCEPYFSHDGKWGYWIAGAGGPVNRIDLATRAVSTVIQKNDRRLHGGPGYLYFPMFSQSGELFTFGASPNQHDHFQSNYDIYVAESDPRTLELLGNPVRYTSHPGPDRYPDVYRAPLALGRHFGEAPFTVRPAPPPGEWSWQWGDGASGGDAAAEHTYARPGSYELKAVDGERTLVGRVVVTEARPPRPIETRIGDDRTVLVGFDEEVDVAAARAVFASKRPIAGLAPGAGGRTLIVTLAKPLAERDSFTLDGIRDRAQRPNPMARATLTVEPPSWPSNRDRLIFLWETADRLNLVRDPTGVERTYRFEAKGGAVYDHDRAMVPAGGIFVAPDELAEHLVVRAQETNTLTLEMTITPASLAVEDAASIVVNSAGKPPYNFYLIQIRDALHFGIRRGQPGNEAPIEIGRLQGTGPVHVIVGYQAGRTVAYLDGKKSIDSDELQGDFFHWRATALTFGAEWGPVRGWRGRIEGVAFYNRLLDDAEAAENHRRYLAIRAGRPAVPRLEVEARLAARSRPPTLQEITPYHEALIVQEYQVSRVVSGSYDRPKLRVAHWAILDDQVLPITQVPAGTESRLVLEPFAGNPQLESTYLADTLAEDYDLPLFYEVRR